MALRDWMKRLLGRRNVGELPRPESTQGDPKATEMVSVWLANGGVHIAVRVGMWQERGTMDEREVWGFLLTEVIRQIGHSMAMQCGWNAQETAEQIRVALMKNADGGGTIQGQFVDNT